MKHDNIEIFFFFFFFFFFFYRINGRNLFKESKWSHTARVWFMSIKSNTSLLQCRHSSQKQHFTKVKNQSSVIWFFKKKKSKISSHTVSNGLRLMYVLIVVSPLQIQTSLGLSLTLCLWVCFPLSLKICDAWVGSQLQKVALRGKKWDWERHEHF